MCLVCDFDVPSDKEFSDTLEQSKSILTQSEQQLSEAEIITALKKIADSQGDYRDEDMILSYLSGYDISKENEADFRSCLEQAWSFMINQNLKTLCVVLRYKK